MLDREGGDAERGVIGDGDVRDAFETKLVIVANANFKHAVRRAEARLPRNNVYGTSRGVTAAQCPLWANIHLNALNVEEGCAKS